MGTIFLNGYNYFKLLDDVAMGSPLGPALANAYLCRHERKWLREFAEFAYAPIFYKLYVDDIFVLLKYENHVYNLLFYLNSKHPNIIFTYEIEKDRCLVFLDINVYRGNNKFETVHRKSTFSGVYTYYKSFIATEYKSSLIATLLHRSFAIASDYHKLHEEIVKSKPVLRWNGFPTRFLDKIISKSLDKSFKNGSVLPQFLKRHCAWFYI